MCGVTLTGCEEVMVTAAADAVDILNSKARVQGVHASIGLLPLARRRSLAVLDLNDFGNSQVWNAFRRWR